MSDQYRAGRLDDRTLEGLLDLDGAHGHARLHALLSAAAGPARPEEVAGEDAAVAAFRAAPRPARASRMHRVAALRRFLTVKIMVLVGGSLILTGGAAAAITGNIPGQEASPAPSTTPGDRTGNRQDRTPANQFAPSGAPAAPPDASGPPGTSKKGNGRSDAPGRPENPGITKKSPRGPGTNQGTPPDANPGNDPETGTGTGTGNQNGTGGNAPPTEVPSGNGKDGAVTGRPD
ncbi:MULTISPECIES: hypothetical protein [unclassified Spirillospora]|uniref:hypothetical protein n=1 Tax=unclassified Spirillospora TaxID=2642701 RepID=UPI0037219B4C